MSKNNNITLLNFLKKYTGISNKFINEYYSFYEMCENNKYGIEIDDVINYLKIVKYEKFITNFKKNYKENIDFIIIKKNNEKKELNKKYTYYYLTLDTFEKICMVSKSEKANSVRDYFITLRKFIMYYKDHISEMIINKATSHPNGCVYIILTNKNKNIFKFGKTEDIKMRLKIYATGHDTHPDIKFIMLVNNKDDVETCVKQLIKKHEFKKNHEIYKIDIELLKDVITDCASLQLKYINSYDNSNVDSYIIFDDIEYFQKTNKKISKKSSKKSSKKTSKKSSKKSSKKTSKN